MDLIVLLKVGRGREEEEEEKEKKTKKKQQLPIASKKVVPAPPQLPYVNPGLER